eukprot:CAMPEP_0116875590 /NCGR_PEP_ID=MMETSP0463-20121206/7621_1 /TAXON_ID=181622 /ORGANISM="Strombidinopsis sp, Strain SopsisLIS2011" /LENGTH=51 /DNA_ID=CAMNT_0004521525 /DNA_START=871 /DNA_END=1026 /DNA_ORIENTATION=+
MTGMTTVFVAFIMITAIDVIDRTWDLLGYEAAVRNTPDPTSQEYADAEAAL